MCLSLPPTTTLMHLQLEDIQKGMVKTAGRSSARDTLSYCLCLPQAPLAAAAPSSLPPGGKCLSCTLLDSAQYVPYMGTLTTILKLIQNVESRLLLGAGLLLCGKVYALCPRIPIPRS